MSPIVCIASDTAANPMMHLGSVKDHRAITRTICGKLIIVSVRVPFGAWGIDAARKWCRKCRELAAKELVE